MWPCGPSVVAVGGGTEHQGYGIPHLHLKLHVTSIYQYGTVRDITRSLEKKEFTYEEWKNFHEWFHAEDTFDDNVKTKISESIEKQWHARFADKEHDFLSVTPDFLAKETAKNLGQEQCTVSNAATIADQIQLHNDAKNFKAKYFAHVQHVFSRVQHDMHKLTKKGYFPLKSCQRKSKKLSETCKHDFPKHKLCIPRSVLVCRGVARKFGLRVSGRRNQLGVLLGRRSDGWQSGTTPSFAAAFGSNTHTLPNWRLAPSAEVHDNEFCSSKKCRDSINDERMLKITAKLAQRAQRQCTGYYCGSVSYTHLTLPTTPYV